MSAIAPEVELAGTAPAVRGPQRQWIQTLRRSARQTRTRVGIGITGLVVLLAIFGPLLAPHSPTEFVGVPYGPESATAPLGTDGLGRDILSRFLYGGRTVIGLSLISTIVGVGLGALIGLVAAHARGIVDDVLMRGNDVLLAFPQIVLALLLVAGGGTHLWLIVLTVGIGHAPRTARIIRGAASEVVERDYIKAVEMLGERRRRVLFKEILPNVSSPLLVEFGLRLTYSIGIVAAVSFLGFGLQPPAADWGLMINENRLGITQQPMAVALPVIAIGLLTVGTNLITDGLARASIGIDRREGA